MFVNCAHILCSFRPIAKGGPEKPPQKILGLPLAVLADLRLGLA